MFEYAPTSPDGPGFALVTDRFVGVISGARASVVRELYALLDQPDARIRDVLDVFVDPSAVDRLALVEVVDPAERRFEVAVRGDVLVDIRGAAVEEADAVGEWTVSAARGVESVRLGLAELPEEAERLPLRRGVVHAAEVRARLPRHEAPDAGPAWTLALPDGAVLDRRVLAAVERLVVGRRPTAGDPAVHLVVAPSPRHEISSDHLELRLVDGVLEARDLESANGTVIRSADRPPLLLHRGGTTRLQAGDTLDLGEGFLITVGARG